MQVLLPVRVAAQFQTVHRQIEALQRDVQVLSSRLRKYEPSCRPQSPRLLSTTAAGSIHRILNAPQSPSYVGPTSAEFGLDRPHIPIVEPQHNSNKDDEHSGDDAPSFSPPPQSPVASHGNGPLADGDPLKSLTLEETLRLIQVYEDNVAIIYPCVDLASVRTYIVESYHARHSRSGGHFTPTPATTLSSRDWFHARDIQVLNILLATALLVESHGRSELAAQLADCVEDRFASRLKIAQVDMKEILILVLLVCHSRRIDSQKVCSSITAVNFSLIPR